MQSSSDQCGMSYDNIVMDKVCNPDQPTQMGFMHKFTSCY